MRWRSGNSDPQTSQLHEENNDTLETNAASGALDHDEQDSSQGNQQSQLDDGDSEQRESHRSSLTATAVATSSDHDHDCSDRDNSSQNEKENPSDGKRPLDGGSDAGETTTSERALKATAILDADDDPGSDHALPPDKSAEAQVPSSWSPQSKQSTCEFTHTIKSYSQKRESGCKKAEYSATTVDESGNRWRLIVYVNGNGRASNHHLSLFLQVADADDLPFGWKKAVSYVLTLEHPTGSNMGYAKRNPDKTFKLCPKAIDWGWSQFITSDRIQQEGYISNDSLTVRASVTVKSSSVNIDSEDAELYLKCAVEEGKADAVKACLSQGASVNCQFKDDLYTPLHTACSSNAITGSLEVLHLLLERGADGNACNKWKETPLLIAANNGHKAAVKALLKNGADPSLCSEAGWSALTFAAHKGYDEIVSMLLKDGAPVNCRVTEDLSTPLHKACAGGKKGHLSAVKQLLDGGADVHALNKWRETPLLTAANHGQADAVEALLKAGGDPCKCTDTGWSPLSIAAYKGHDDVVRLLLEEGAPTEEADPTLSALLQAATKGLPDTVELLLRHGADHTVTTKKGDTALSILVEQNLIDAAVDMVTEYKASVPRCSRDRKKVQRARLLINLQMKKQQKEGLMGLSSDDETDQDESDESRSALHENGSPQSAGTPSMDKKKKKKNKKSSRVSAEEQARAAEEALLLELEQEDAKAQKEEEAANTKRAKKKKKRERERQQKLQEEREQREKEEKEEKEREQQRKLKEEQERKERERKAKEQRVREMEEMAARRKEIEERMKLEKKKKKVESTTGHVSPIAFSPTADKRTKGSANAGGGKKTHVDTHKSADGNRNNVKTPKSASPKLAKQTRGWETKTLPSVPALKATKSRQVNAGAKLQPAPQAPVIPEKNDTSVGSFVARPQPVVSVEDDLQNMATGVVDFLGFDSQPAPGSAESPSGYSASPGGMLSQSPSVNQHIPYATSGVSGGMLNNGRSGYSLPGIEHPAVALFREEKLSELFKRIVVAHSPSSGTDPLSVVDESTTKTVLYRWIVRAAHEKAHSSDDIIPSWTDLEEISAFFQRQFISENRKGVNTSGGAGIVSMEALKEAGTAMAILCQSLAKDLEQFRAKLESQLPRDWADSSIPVTASEVMTNGGGSMIVLDWANRAQVFIPTLTFSKLRDRYAGPPSRLLTALFSAKKTYDVLRMIVAGTPMDFRLLPNTQAILAREAFVSVELWVDPFSYFGSNSFCGIFSRVDMAFGGLLPFGKDEGGGEMSLVKSGGSVSVLPPLDSLVAARYVQRMVDILEMTDKEGTPLSFAVFLPSECFRDMNRRLDVTDLSLLDSRLGDRFSGYIRHAEVLPLGRHAYQHGDGVGLPEICATESICALLQNEAGMVRFAVSDEAIPSIINSMILNGDPVKEIPQDHNPIMFTNGAALMNEPLNMGSVGIQEAVGSRSPSQDSNPSEFGAIGGTSIPSSYSGDSRRIGRRGRLFELIDDGDDEQTNDIDVMSGMLNNLNVNLFQSTSSQEVDIEAISLMGIGGNSISGAPPGGAHGSRGFG